MLLDHYKNHVQNLPNADQRMAALARLDALGMPSKRMEDWRYTDLKALTKKDYVPATGNSAGFAQSASPFDDAALEGITATITLVNGELAEGTDIAALSDLGLVIEANTDGAIISFDGFDLDSLSLMNQALATSTLSLRVPAGKDIGTIHIRHHITSAELETLQNRQVIQLAEGAKLTLLHEINATGSNGWCHTETSVDVLAGAELHQVHVIHGNTAGFLSMTEQAVVTGGTYGNHTVAQGIGAGRHRVEVHLTDKNSHFDARGASLVNTGENFETLTRVYHAVPEADCDQVFKNVVAKQGTATFQGRIRVEKDAQLTNADMACKNLLLDRTAEANIKPELLIFADDVKCSHGATVGELDEKALFYLQQRGIPYEEAKTIMVRAFLGDVVEDMPLSFAMKEAMMTSIDQWMADAMANLANASS